MIDDLIKKDTCPKCDNGYYSIGTGASIQIVPCDCQQKSKVGLVNIDQRRAEMSIWLQERIPNPRYLEEFNEQKWQICAHAVPASKSQKFLTAMTDLLKEISTGTLPRHSYMFVTNDTGGKKYFIYSFMKQAFLQGYNPSPLLELWKVTENLRKGVEDKETTYFSYDVLLLTTGGYFHRNEINTLRFLLQGCELRKIPVILISSYPRTYMASANNFYTPCVSPLNASPGAYSELVYHHLEE